MSTDETGRGSRPSPQTFNLQSDNVLRLSAPLRSVLAEHVARINEVGLDADRRYSESLQRLRGRASEAVPAIREALKKAPSDDYSARWALTHTAASLGTPLARPLLREQALAPIPKAGVVDPHGADVVEETVLRTTAVEGLADLARQGDDEAIEALFECLKQPATSVRAAAVQGLLASPGGAQLKKRIAEALPPEQKFLTELRIRNRPLPVGNPTHHLATHGRERRLARATPPPITDNKDSSVRGGIRPLS